MLDSDSISWPRVAVPCKHHGLSDQDVFVSSADAPVVQLSLGAALQAGSIKQGSDLYFKCMVDATPPAHSVLWMRGVSGGQGKVGKEG